VLVVVVVVVVVVSFALVRGSWGPAGWKRDEWRKQSAGISLVRRTTQKTPRTKDDHDHEADEGD
jgi:hypothetical protein